MVPSELPRRMFRKEDTEGRMLFGSQDAILVFDNNRWETISAPGTGYIRSFVTTQVQSILNRLRYRSSLMKGHAGYEWNVAVAVPNFQASYLPNQRAWYEIDRGTEPHLLFAEF